MPDSSMGKLASCSFQAEAPALGEIAVTVRRIDSLLQSREILPPNVVKIDVEGAELDVLSGAAEMLRHVATDNLLGSARAMHSRRLARNDFCDWATRSTVLNAIFRRRVGAASRLSAMTSPLGGLPMTRTKRRVAILTAAPLSRIPAHLRRLKLLRVQVSRSSCTAPPLTRVSEKPMRGLLVVTVSLSGLCCPLAKTDLSCSYSQSGGEFVHALGSI